MKRLLLALLVIPAFAAVAAAQSAPGDAVAGKAQQMAEAVHRVLPELAERISAVASGPGEPDDLVEADDMSQSWLLNQRPQMLDRLREWLEQVLIHYPGSTQALGPCWPLHPWIVEELLALRAAWFEAYEGERASATRTVDWHDRYRPGVVRRITEHISGCSEEAHRKGGRLDPSTRSSRRYRS